jgi:hypothetical protein
MDDPCVQNYYEVRTDDDPCGHRQSFEFLETEVNRQMQVIRIGIDPGITDFRVFDAGYEGITDFCRTNFTNNELQALRVIAGDALKKDGDQLLIASHSAYVLYLIFLSLSNFVRTVLRAPVTPMPDTIDRIEERMFCRQTLINIFADAANRQEEDN